MSNKATKGNGTGGGYDAIEPLAGYSSEVETSDVFDNRESANGIASNVQGVISVLLVGDRKFKTCPVFIGPNPMNINKIDVDFGGAVDKSELCLYWQDGKKY
jgi:hypothetical protein